MAVNDDLVLVVSLVREEKRLSNTELRALKKIRPVVDAACRRNWRYLSIESTSRSHSMEDRIAGAFRSIGQGVLTLRERQLVELTLRGHSADAIGKRLEISSGTVRLHRRNIYTKLRMSSQGLLFSHFINAMLKSGTHIPPS